ncbi:Pre-mRNA cleavage complex 2 protein Pcf11 [Dissostichus eleginoides]|uniref:Pre-mRNA cleavage complex 2 protein Pcf11 n=1 Tax=Dissostichus eleginoides TaxID=100907 RepID=A0AAD9ER65_DISEL|nr:Pre-mRNA cleavage complex 2 protein Pcf11 [Dissostichus eleginoides]
MADKDACREYSSLEDLTFNSKPHINMLTILAEENLHFAKEIVAIIEAQISKALSAEKLPVLYLVDSIVKNVGGEYLAVFAKNLITSFICVFEKVDENTRKSLFKLRSTWEDVFPLKKLYALDVRVNSVDPAWPIKALPPSVSNASIHVNPKFLKQPTPSKPPALQAPPPALQATPPDPHPPPPAQVTPVPPSSLTQESLIPQLMGGFVMPPAVPVKPGPPAAPGVRPWLPPPQPDPKPPTRDPRLNRAAGTPTGKKEGHAHTGSAAVTPEKPPRPEKPRTPRKEAPKPPTTISSSPITKSVPMKPKPAENETKKDPRLKKRGGGAVKEEELKKKKEEPLRGGGNKGKLLNGSKHDEEKMEFKAGGNARTHARKRSRSPPVSPPKRKERRRTRSSSLSPPPPSHKPGKPPRREPEHGKKKSQSESRRSKRPVEDPPHPPHSPRGHDGAKEGKDGPAPPHRWRSGWEENKHPKPEDPHLKPATPRHKPYSAPTRPQTPRTPKHRLSVDANMQIPEVLNSASKKDLLRRASKRLESGEISQEDFLNMAHQIKHFFQYQEEKQRPDSWDPLSGLPRPTLTSGAPRPPLTSGGPRPPPATMDAAELSYYEHKLKLRKTQVNRRAAGEEWEGDESPEEGEGEGEGAPPGKYSRGPRDRPGE